jgi:hypothetical protein
MTKGIRTAVAAAVLGATGAMTMTTSLPLQAYTFVREFERSSSSPNKVSFLERVLYSLIEANNRSQQCRAPRSA